ncbi:hypothetical protein [Exiguobacterium sp. s193]|uniref:hypothetical protein n=1 Tax=Exiguobacterium sp. s193 TaxID=2751207 RepID=UPI001BEC41D2|nr:hypothetical protein [Exiguobacterium sp. s193]
MSVFNDYEDWLDEETDEIIDRHAAYAVAELALGGEVGDYYVDAGLIDQFVMRHAPWLLISEIEEMLAVSENSDRVELLEPAVHEEEMQRQQAEHVLRMDVKDMLALKTRPFIKRRLKVLAQEVRPLQERQAEAQTAFNETERTIETGPAPKIIPKRWYRRERVLEQSFTDEERKQLDGQLEVLQQQLVTEDRTVAAVEREMLMLQRALDEGQ